MSQIGQRERQTQNRVVNFLQKELGWMYLGDWQEREGNSQLEKEALLAFLQKQGYADSLIQRALFEVEAVVYDQSGKFYDINQQFYKLLRYGVKVKSAHEAQHETVWLIDWEQPENNQFAFAEEVTLSGPHDKRPDIVFYVNGLALGVLELKRGKISVEEGIRQNLDNQKPEFIQSFFHTQQLVMAGNDSQGLRYGTTETPAKYYLRWKEVDASRYPDLVHPAIAAIHQKNQNLLDQDLASVCHPERFLSLIRDFIIFDYGTKKICRPNQYFGVLSARKFIRRREGGIIWHTQGSGKSLTMVWLAQWIREHIPDARVLIITDRDELDKQIEGVFYQVGEQIYRSKSGKDLLAHLNTYEYAMLCSLVHKFGSREEGDYDSYIAEIQANLPKDFSPKGDLYVFVDECHRTQSGKLHQAMKVILPNALFIGFTGTPLLKKDKKKSLEIFGPYIHTYKFDEAVKDEVVLDLQYEAKDIDQHITDQQSIDEWFEAETAGLTDLVRTELKKRWGTMQKVLSSKSRLEKISMDILKDFKIKVRLRSGQGNAMLVAGSVYQACKFYKIFQDAGFKECAIITSYEPSISKIKGESTGEGSTEELQKYEIYQQMLDGKSTDEFETEVKRQFVHEPARMKLLIVVDKLLTGFDAPPATYLYIDKNMQDHGLFQAICRVNRLHTADKEVGYIIDYKDLFRSLEKSITDYTSEAFDLYDKEDVAGLLNNRLEKAREKLEECLEKVRAMCEPVHPQDQVHFIRYFCGDVRDPDALKEHEDRRFAFYKATASLFRAWANIANEMAAAGYSQEEKQSMKAEVQLYEALREEIQLAAGEKLDLKDYEPGMRQLIDMYISADPSRKISAFDDMSLIQLIVEKGEGAVEELPENIRGNREAVAEIIENNLRKVIIEESLTNPVYYARMSVLLDELIQARREEAQAYEEYLRRVVELTRLINQPARSQSYPSALQKPAQRALYDNLGQDEDTALMMDREILYVRKDSWRGNRMKEREIKIAIQKILPEGYDIEEIFNIVKNQDEY